MNKKLLRIIIALNIAFALVFIGIKNRNQISLKFALLSNKIENRKERDKTIKGQEELRYGVSSSNILASEIGMKVLENGGNAVDAAIAISFALNISDPQNSGIGGGGGMLIKDTKTGKQVFYDYYISSGDKIPSSNIGIPGFLKGMDLISKEMGTMSLSDLIQYSVDLGEKGILVTKEYANMIKMYDYISVVNPAFAKNGRPLVEGEMLYQTELIETLKEIQQKGADIFYNGEHQISKNFLELTGISKKSLKAYKVNKYEPLEIKYRGYDIIAPPAPFSGMVMLQSFLLEEKLDIPKVDFANSDYNNIIKEILQFEAIESRDELGDPAYFEIDYSEKLDISYLTKKFNSYTGKNISIEEPESDSTTGFAVIDKDGMIVSATNTISSYWGSFVVRDGIIYNNAMKNFSVSHNVKAANKRPKTGISPIIITDNNNHKEAIASSGGLKILSFIFRAIVNSKKEGIDVQTANDMRRTYYTNRTMYFEAKPPYSADSNVSINYQGGHKIIDSKLSYGSMHGLEIKSNGDILGHYDKRNYLNGGSIYFDGTKKVYARN